MSVFVAGKGIISAIGLNVPETLQALLHGKSGIGPISYLPTVKKESYPSGEVALSNTELAALAGLSEKLTRTALLSSIAAQEAARDAGLQNLEGLRMGFISATTVGGMDLTEKLMKSYFVDHQIPDAENILYHDCGAVTEVVAAQLGIKHFVSTVSTACSSSVNSIMYAARLINHGILDIAIAGGTDALSVFTLNGFSSLMILDEKPCMPYDENRRGLNLGEGAAYLVLVSEKVAQQMAGKCSIKISGYANANDAFHATASSPEGKGNFLAMKGALAMSGLAPQDISYVNLHGTGTSNNDLSEGIALQRIFDDKVPPASSTKTFTGHTLGACGALEALISCLCISNGFIPANLRFQTPMKELSFTPVTSTMQGVNLKHVLSNSFGFGGNCSSIILSEV